MNCDQVRIKLRLFQEDLLPQYERYAIREHLFNCVPCQELSQKFGEKSLGQDSVGEPHLPPPDPEAVKALNLKLERDFQVKESAPRPEFSIPWMRLLFFILFTVFLGLGIVYFSNFLDTQMLEESSLSTQISPSGHDDKTSSTSGSGSSENSLSSGSLLDREVTVRPLHWDIYFPSSAARDSLRAKVLAIIDLRCDYESENLLVVQGQKSGFQKLVGMIETSGGALKSGGAVRSITLPESAAPLRVSLALHSPQSRVTQALAHHWHIRFDLPNRFLLKESLQSVEARFVFEANDLWVIEIAGGQLEKIKETLRSTHGVVVNFQDDSISADSYKDIPVVITLYIEEG